MDKERIMGIIDEVAGTAKRKAGELTGNTQLQVEGIVQQAKGKVENSLGKAKDAVRAANAETEVRHDPRV
jgi:uncharacterized protein YjbJ (UPF0337 family)